MERFWRLVANIVGLAALLLLVWWQLMAILAPDEGSPRPAEGPHCTTAEAARQIDVPQRQCFGFQAL
jgi:hypothetical protein